MYLCFKNRTEDSFKLLVRKEYLPRNIIETPYDENDRTANLFIYLYLLNQLQSVLYN